MNHDIAQELLGAYALDAVDGAERDELEAHLQDCAKCRAEVSEHRDTAAWLAHAGAPAPDGLWDRIADSLEPVPPKLALVPSGAAPAPRRRYVTTMLAAGLAAAALVAAVLGVQVRQQAERLDRVEIAVGDPLSAAAQTAMDAAGTRTVELTSTDGRTRVAAVLTKGGIGYLRAGALPKLAAGRTYQLWGASDGRLVSLGVLGNRPGVVAFPTEAYAAFAITEEESPGVVSSANLPVVSGAVVA